MMVRVSPAGIRTESVTITESADQTPLTSPEMNITFANAFGIAKNNIAVAANKVAVTFLIDDSFITFSSRANLLPVPG